MPIIIDAPEEEAIGLDELCTYLHDLKIDTADHDAMIAAAPMLKQLANNRTFLADMALEELKGRTKLGAGSNRYGPQVMMLYPPNRRDQTFFVRANFWPSTQDHIFKSSGPEQFFYHHPHDHSFNFLTVGYYGPGYRSNYYVYDYEKTAGFPGEAVDLKYVETTELTEGKLMLYRACVDIHDQLPPETMSMSLNIMELTVRGGVLDQYSFDTEHGCVGTMINRMSTVSLMPMLGHLGDADSLDFLTETARSHISERVRFAALKAKASAQASVQDTMTVFEEGTRSDSALVAGWARQKLGRLEALVS